MTNSRDPAAAGDGDDTAAADFSPDAMRIGDTERTSALDALAEHLTAGRITLDEYGERSARVTVTRTVGELVELFDDLPAPHPVIAVPGAAAPARVSASAALSDPAGALAAADRRSRAQKIVAAAAAASVFVALALFFITGSWLWFLLIPAISAVAQAMWGPDWREPDHRHPRELRGGSGRQ